MNSPIEILETEHKLIERLLPIITNKIESMKQIRKVDPQFIDLIVDFFEGFVDRNHHHKEEGIYFKQLESKSMSAKQKALMNHLIIEHQQSREVVGKMVEANHRYISGDPSGFADILSSLEFFMQFYPPHIKIENESFFQESLEYFSPGELQALLEEFNKYDPASALQKYSAIVESLENQ